MTKKSKISIALINAIIVILSVCGMVFLLTHLELPLKILAYVCIMIFGGGTILFILLDKEKFAKTCFAINVFVFVVLAIFFILNICGIFENFSDLQYLKNLILQSGTWGVAVCVVIQLLQVIVLPAPGWIFYLAVTAIYGPFWAFVICYLSTLVGSLIAFAIGRNCGKKAVEWCVGKEDARKYAKVLSKKGKVPFIIMQLLPFFPDDVLCMVAGLSDMSYRFFFLAVAFTRVFYVAFVCFLGMGSVIPFTGWGIGVWISIFALIITFCALYFFNQNKIDAYLAKKFIKKGKNNRTA